MTVTLDMAPADEAFIAAYAARKNLSAEGFVRRLLQEKIEDMKDNALYEEAMAEYKADPATYTHEEVGKMLGLVK